MISLRGLTGHTLKNYCTYIRVYLDYLSNFLHKAPEDVSWDELRDYIRWLQKSRGRSDRYAILSKKALDILTAYWFAFGRPMDWLFPKQFQNDKPIDTFYLSRHIHDVERSLGWPERITCHSPRHAFGTHLYEDGVDLLTIKSLLGHKSLHSTTIYVHLASNGVRNAISPFDRFGDNGHAK